MLKRGLSLALLAGFAATSLAQSGSAVPYPVFETDKTPMAELRARREKVKARVGPDSVAVFFTNPVRNRNNDVDFLFRADSTFLYLTGFEEPDAALVLVPGGIDIDGRRTTEILFVNEPDQMSATWLGYRMGPANAVSMLGVHTSLSNKRFDEVVRLCLGAYPKVATKFTPDGMVGTLRTMANNLAKARQDLGVQAGPRVDQAVNAMRGVKSPWEINVMRRVCKISANAHVQVMKAIRPDQREYQMESLVQYMFGNDGCEYTGYPSICGSGPNSTILHYNSNRRQMKSGDIYCMDAAGEYHGYSADVTRSMPVNGKFSAEQRAIYQVVYEAQTLGISMCRNGAKVGEIGKAINDSLAAGLMKLGVIEQPAEIRRYYMHGFGHGLGLDVHDPMPSVLQPGVILTVEPGVYIKEDSPCDPKWWNIGIRIEDDILVTEAEPENLSQAAPRTWQEVEKVMSAGRRSNQNIGSG